MLRRVFIVTVFMLLGSSITVCAADLAETLRQKLPSLKGKARLQALYKLQELSVTSPDVEYRTRCYNELIDEAEAQHEDEIMARAIRGRTVHFYNNDQADSIAKYVPQDMSKLRERKMWNDYYEVWYYLLNNYIFSEQLNTALREVQRMFDDAKVRNNEYGMGIAYYTMGLVYANMHNPEQSAESYRKGLNMLSTIKPKPATVADLYSYYGDLLNETKNYEQLQELTKEWKTFIESFVEERKVDDISANILWSYYYLACAQAALGLHQTEEGAKMLDEVHRLIPSEDDYVGQSWLFYSAQLSMQRGEYRKAQELNLRRMKQLEESEDPAAFVQVASQRVEILKHLNRFEEAADYCQRIIELKDSISGTETRNQLNELNTLFRVDELKMAQAQAQMRNTIIIASIIVLALIIFTIFRIRAARRLKKAHDKLQETHEELLTAYDQLEETTAAKERIESDLRIARNIQMGMVPHTFPERPDLDLYAFMKPAKEVGGDLYGYYLTGNKLYIALGDVSGKGVPASLFMAQATRLFRTLAAQGMMPSEICSRINDALSGEDNETSMFVTMFLGLIDLETGHLDFCNAGHNPPVLLKEGRAEFIEMIPNAPIGLWPGLEYEGEEIQDITNCPLFVYTDGLNEAENRQQEQFTDERLLEIMETRPFVSCRQTIEMLRDEVEKHRDGAEPNDDLTMLCVKFQKSDNNQ